MARLSGSQADAFAMREMRINGLQEALYIVEDARRVWEKPVKGEGARDERWRKAYASCAESLEEMIRARIERVEADGALSQSDG